MSPGTPSTGPGLKPNDRNLAWTSLISSRCSAVWFGAGSTAAGWLPVIAAGSVCAAAGTTAGVSAMLAAGDGDEGAGADDAESSGAGAGAAAVLSRGDAGSRRAAASGDGGTGPEPTVVAR